MENKEEENAFKCLECNSTFSCKGNLTRHHKENHTDDAIANLCPSCGESFTRRDNLIRHFDTKHKNENGTCSM